MRFLILLLAALLSAAGAATPGPRRLTDADFEAVTQAATGQTTGKWCVGAHGAFFFVHARTVRARPHSSSSTRTSHNPTHTHTRLVAFHAGAAPPAKLAAALADLAPALAKSATFIATVGTGAGGARTAARFFGGSAAAAVEEAADKHGVARYALLADRKVHVLPAVGTAREDGAPALKTLLAAFVADPDAAGAPAVDVPAPPSALGAGGVSAAAHAVYGSLPPSVQARLDAVAAALADRGVDPAKAGAAGAGLAVVLVAGALGGRGGGGGGAQARGGAGRRKRE